MKEITPEEERLKELITEARQTIKDLNALKKNIDAYIRSTVDERIEEELKRGLDLFGTTLKSALVKSEAAIFKRFDRLENTLMGDGKKNETLEDLLITYQTLENISKKSI